MVVFVHGVSLAPADEETGAASDDDAMPELELLPNHDSGTTELLDP